MLWLRCISTRQHILIKYICMRHLTSHSLLPTLHTHFFLFLSLDWLFKASRGEIINHPYSEVSHSVGELDLYLRSILLASISGSAAVKALRFHQSATLTKMGGWGGMHFLKWNLPLLQQKVRETENHSKWQSTQL